MKGLIIESDFVLPDGPQILFDTARNYLKKLDGIDFTPAAEARFFYGHDYLEAMTNYFEALKTKKTPQKAAREIEASFNKALLSAIPNAVNDDFRQFIATIAAKGVKIVIATRVNSEVMSPAFAGILEEGKVGFHWLLSSTYGTSTWDYWRRISQAQQISRMSTMVLTGTAAGVKSAIMGGVGAVGIIRDHVAYQDFGGANELITELTAESAKKVLYAMRVD